jgi:LuxR family maltose regulon positive regulatory protein
MARVVRARALEERGRVSEARDALDAGVNVSERGVASIEIGYALLSQAEARQLEGDAPGAAAAVREARAIVRGCPRPGILEHMLGRTEHRLRRASRPGPDAEPVELTDRELSVLRLLPSQLSQREIADALYVSLNTVKSHTKSIYRKLSVDTRDAAVSRGRELGVL